MAKNLVIVESPAKAKTIEGYLGSEFIVKSSYGHVRDLAKKGLAIEIDNKFNPLYEVTPDKKQLVTELKKLVVELLSQGGNVNLNADQTDLVNRLYTDVNEPLPHPSRILPVGKSDANIGFSHTNDAFETHVEFEESLSLEDREKELIQKALDKHRGKRKYAASELGISERTLYRKIKEFNLIDL